MTCKICKEKIPWDYSHGKRDFLICHDCYEKLQNNPRLRFSFRYNPSVTLDFIFACGDIVEDNKKNFKNLIDK